MGGKHPVAFEAHFRQSKTVLFITLFVLLLDCSLGLEEKFVDAIFLTASIFWLSVESLYC